MTSWIGQGTVIETPPSLERVAVTCEAGGHASAVHVRQKDRSTVTMVRTGEPAVRDGRSCTVGSYRTNARLLQYSRVEGALQAVMLADGDHAIAVDDRLVSIAAPAPLADLHVTLRRSPARYV